MKENILYAYHIQVDQIKEYKEYSVFEWNQKTYYFTKVRRNQEEYQDLLEVIRELEQKKIPILPFIVNVYGSYLTEINNEAYVLIEVDNPLHEYNLVDMLERNKSVVLNSKKNNLYRNEWGRLWSQKVDYLEYQVSEMGKKYPIIVNSFSYFVGLAENAISYANHVTRTIKIPNSPIVLSHRRVGFPNYRLNYDNPLSFIFDLEVRDIAEYLKNMVFQEEELPLIELKAYIDLRRPDLYNLSMLYARLLYPSYYFDLHEKIINEDESEEVLLPIIDAISKQEVFLKKAWLLIREYVPLEPVDWIIKKEL